MTTTSSGSSRPTISPITLCEVYVPATPASMSSRTVTGTSRASIRASWSASGLDSAAAGIFATPSACFIAPVCGSRSRSVPTERISSAAAPLRAASTAPPPRIADAGV